MRGKAAKKIWYETDVGKACEQRELAAKREKSLDRYLNRPIVAVDSEGRAPLYTIDSKGRTPLERWKETGLVSKDLTKDNSGHYWEPHEISLIGAATIDRPYGTPIGQAIWQPPKIFQIVRQRRFEPPCERLQGYTFYKKYAIKIRPHMDIILGELRWPDDPYGELHKDDPLYKKPPKNQKRKFQFIRKITLVDTFRFSPMSFVETIRPLMKRGLILKEAFDTIEREKLKRGGFHLEPMENVKTIHVL